MTETQASPQVRPRAIGAAGVPPVPPPDATLEGRLRRVGWVALVAGIAATVLLVIGFFFADRSQWLQSYLVAYLYWLGLSLGCLALLMVHILVGGPWGLPIQRLLTAGARPLFLMALLFLPILLGARYLYAWTDAALMQADPVLQAKALYLNLPFFTLRAALYFAVWLILTYVLTRNAYRQDETGAPHLARRSQRFSAPGLILFGLTVSFAAIDWAMSLEAYWYSSIYGLLFVSRQVLLGLAFVIAVLGLICHRPALAWVTTTRVSNDLGGVLLAAVFSWVYLFFMQFLIIWFANLPQEVTWYLNRTGGGWQWLLYAVIFLHFALPLGLILVYEGRWRISTLAAIGAVIVLADLLYVYWLVAPAFSPQGPALHWLDLAALVAMGAFWLAWFLYDLRRHSLVPFRHPRYVAFVEEEQVEQEQYETATRAS